MSDPRLPWLITYDIRCPRRLTRLHRFLCQNAAPVQYSVFVGEYRRNEIDWLCQQISGIIDARVDDVRCYPIPKEPCLSMIGAPRCPEGWALLQQLLESNAALPTIAQGLRPKRRGRPPQVVDISEKSAP